jgi:hypothetical protein
VSPSATTLGHLVRLWGDRFGASRRITFRLLGRLSPGALPQQARFSLAEEDGQPVLLLEEGLTLTTAVSGVPRQGPLPLHRLHRAGREDWLLALDLQDELLVRVPPPPPPVLVGPPLPPMLEERLLMDRTGPPSSTGEVPRP